MTAVLLAPHNDDESLFAFYSLTRNQAHVIVVLRSMLEAERGGPTFETRERETDCAMRVAGRTWEQWPYPDSEPPWALIESRLEAVTEEVGTIIAPAYEEGGHEHHNELALIAQRLRPDGEGLIQYLTYVRGQERSTGGTEIVPTLFEREQKRIALLCYQSQIDYEPTRPWFGPDQREHVT